MKQREIQQFKMKPVAELSKLIRESEEKIRKLRFDLAAGKVKNVAELRNTRRLVARMYTFIAQQSQVKNTPR